MQTSSRFRGVSSAIKYKVSQTREKNLDRTANIARDVSRGIFLRIITKKMTQNWAMIRAMGDRVMPFLCDDQPISPVKDPRRGSSGEKAFSNV
jgi:hypothetical protein